MHISFTDVSPDDIIRKRVALVKLYSWIKEEMSRTSARSIAHYMYQHDQHVLSAAEHENICNCKLRRDAVEQLLKRVLMGPDEIFDIFIEILKGQEEDHITEKLLRTAPSDEEIEGNTAFSSVLVLLLLNFPAMVMSV